MPMAIHMDGGSLFSYYETLPAMSECRPPPHSSSLRYRFRSRKQDVRHPTHFQVQGTGFSAHIPAHSLTSFFSSVHIEFPTKDLLVSHGPDGATGHARVCASYWLVLVLYIGHLFTFKVLVSTQNLYSLPTVLPLFGPGSKTSSHSKCPFCCPPKFLGSVSVPNLEKDFSLLYWPKCICSSGIRVLSVHCCGTGLHMITTSNVLLFDIFKTWTSLECGLYPQMALR